ncbi:iron-containing alcohol dehydrogenase [Anaerocolumna xylanovorans]|uniref:Glycerol-1-phosphate dehydrogenase [NAD(P)+] n=1 Tax=Anaerocolumna xylanovorans DSM 12503 TaxID=1121345 RepID=A0A1M7YLN0_9FIRM|nr:iron-containing alcohol dehydrogenase [Anaerocolumna xylanovorans]SHO53530.1 glycerol-1-phosphate dehydrogenase [NAD(P)+] [Anaerocolumna xylanovorans DSM 12503]
MQIDINSFRRPCNCGRTHEIFVKDILIEENALKRLPEKVRSIFDGRNTEIAVICDTNTYQAAGKTVEKLLPGCELIILPANDLRADNCGITLARKGLLSSGRIKLIIAAGAGTIHDISRYLAMEFRIPFVSVPTAASTDSYASVISILTMNGSKKNIPGDSPVLIIADTLILAKAPYRLTASGITKILRKYTALTDWEISHMVTGEYICQRICEMEMSALKEVCLYSNDLKGNTRDKNTLRAYEKLIYALLLSGIAMQMVGSISSASGGDDAAHLWEKEAVNELFETYHGEKISIGLMVAVHTCHKLKNTVKNGINKVMPNREIESMGKGRTYEEVVKENALDSLPAISGILGKLPTESDLRKLLTAAGYKREIRDIKLEERLVPLTKRLDFDTRNRLIFLKFTKFFKLKNEA